MTQKTAKKELPACPVETTLMLIGDKWKVLILRDLLFHSLSISAFALFYSPGNSTGNKIHFFCLFCQ